MTSQLDNPATFQTYRQVLRYMRQKALRVEDRLPSHLELSRQLQCGTPTLQNVMRLLEKHGVLARRPKTGTIIKRLGPQHPVPWTVGLLLLDEDAARLTPFHAVVLELLLMEFLKHSCRLRLYGRRAVRRQNAMLKDFSGLEADVREGLLDAVLATTQLERQAKKSIGGSGVAYFDLMEPGSSRCVHMDESCAVEDAVNRYAKQGCRHIALISDDGSAGSNQEAWLAMQSVVTRSAVGVSEFHAGCGLWHGGQLVARKLLALSASKRPDALICVSDDHIALGLTQALQEDGNYQPAIAVVTNRQAPLAFFLPVLRYEFDLQEIAQKSVQRVVLELRGDAVMQPKIIVPKLIDSEPSKVPQLWKEHQVPRNQP